MHVLYDSIDLSAIPASAGAVAGYVDGHWPTFPEIRRRWPTAHHLSITVTAGGQADVLDVELGDATPPQAVSWLLTRLLAGARRPCLYASLDLFEAQLLPLLRRSHIPRGGYRLWVADWTGEAHIPPHYGACQWTDRALGRNLDESLTLPGFFVP